MFHKTIWAINIIHKDYQDEPQTVYFWFYKSAKKFVKKVEKSKNYKCIDLGGEGLWFKCGKHIQIPKD